MPFLKALAQREKEIALCRIQTRFFDFISDDKNHFAKRASNIWSGRNQLSSLTAKVLHNVN